MKSILGLLSLTSIIFIYSKPINALSITLYDGMNLPEDNNPQWLAPGAILSTGMPTSVSSTPVLGGVGVQVDSNENGAEYSGYSNYNPVTSSFINGNFQTLDNNAGYSVFFNVALDTTNDFFDDSDHRAVFSVTVIGNGNQGIEIGFDSNQIFAQNSNFTQSEAQAFTTNSSTNYQLAILGNNYELLADTNTGSGFASVLNGSLRTYDFNPSMSDPPLGAFNPYKTPGFLFFGDNTGQAYGTFTLGKISLATTSVPFDFSPNLGLALLGVSVGVKKLLTARHKQDRALIEE